MASVFLNVEKAFDKVQHEGLLFKLSTLNLPTEIVKTFLTDRTFTIKVEDCFSSTRLIFAGVPQGSCFSPTLYLAYINDLTTIPKVKLVLFADDTMFLTENKNAERAAIQLQHQRHYFRSIEQLPPLLVDNQTIDWCKLNFTQHFNNIIPKM